MIDFSVYDKKQPEIYAYKCPSCGTAYYPVPMICGKCSSRRDPSGMVYPEWDKFQLEGPCKLLTWTRVWALPEGYDKPYLLFGIVEFPDGLRAAGQLEVENPTTGMNLVAHVEESTERPGKTVNVFVFSKD